MAARQQYNTRKVQQPALLGALSDDWDNIATLAMRCGYREEWLTPTMMNHWRNSRRRRQRELMDVSESPPPEPRRHAVEPETPPSGGRIGQALALTMGPPVAEADAPFVAPRRPLDRVRPRVTFDESAPPAAAATSSPGRSSEAARRSRSPARVAQPSPAKPRAEAPAPEAARRARSRSPALVAQLPEARKPRTAAAPRAPAAPRAQVEPKVTPPAACSWSLPPIRSLKPKTATRADSKEADPFGAKDKPLTWAEKTSRERADHKKKSRPPPSAAELSELD